MPTIVDEVNLLKKHYMDLDNLRGYYIDGSIPEKLNVIYPSASIEKLEDVYFRLLFESDIITFNEKWNMRPDYASYDIYGSIIYWPVLLFINNIQSIELFRNLEHIISPRIAAMEEIINLFNELPIKEDFVKNKEPDVLNIILESENKFYKDISERNKDKDDLINYIEFDNLLNPVPPSKKNNLQSESEILCVDCGDGISSIGTGVVSSGDIESIYNTSDAFKLKEEYEKNIKYGIYDEYVVRKVVKDKNASQINEISGEIINEFVEEFEVIIELSPKILKEKRFEFPGVPIRESSVRLYLGNKEIELRYGYDFTVYKQAKDSNLTNDMSYFVSWEPRFVKESMLSSLFNIMYPACIGLDTTDNISLKSINGNMPFKILTLTFMGNSYKVKWGINSNNI